MYYLGNGRGKGYRVERDSLLSALDTKKVSLDKPQKRAKKSNKFEGSMKDIMLSLTKEK